MNGVSSRAAVYCVSPRPIALPTRNPFSSLIIRIAHLSDSSYYPQHAYVHSAFFQCTGYAPGSSVVRQLGQNHIITDSV